MTFRSFAGRISRLFHLRMETRAFNSYHDTFSLRLASRNYLRTRKFLLILYDAGSVLGVFGMFAAIILLVWTAMSLSSSALLRLTTPHTSTRLLKRAGDVTSSVRTSPSAYIINPIIPGLTVPLMHLPLIMLSLCISQVVHESGHAIAAAIHRIPVLVAGASITFIFPAAFVSLPSAKVEELSPVDRLRVVTSGCFHNLAFWLILLGTAWSGLGPWMLSVGYKDVSARGLIVANVETESPLSVHLPVGSFITALDDVWLNSSYDAWSTYLLEPTPAVYKQGWCANASQLIHTEQCCANTNSGDKVSPLSCFISFGSEVGEYCIDPVPILSKTQNRCTSSAFCLESQSCVQPRGDRDLLRITVHHQGKGTEDEHVVLWSGPMYEVWEQVQITHFASRLNILPLGLPLVLTDFLRYLKLTNLSLYLLNSLPLPALDGSQLLIILLEMAFTGWLHSPSTMLDLESLRTRRGRSNRSGMQRVLRTFVVIGTCALVGSCITLGIIEWISL